MSGNNQFEILMQQKMDGFMVEPVSSDWQAIYDRLHPRNKRRIIWWWFPLIAALGAGFFWIYQPTNTRDLGAVVATNTVTNNNKDVSGVEKNSTAISSTTGQQNKNNSIPAGTNQTTTSDNKANLTRSDNRVQSRDKTKVTNTTAVPVKTTLTENKRLPKNQNKNATADPVDPDKNIVANSDKKTPDNLIKNSVADPNKEVVADPNKDKTTDPNNTPASDPNKVVPLDPNKDAPQVEKTSSIPVKSKSNRWQWAGYIGAGPNYPSDPLSLGAKALAASAPDYNSGSSITYTTNSRENGWHLAVGIMAEKKMGNNWKFSAGLGLNSSTWTSKSEKFKDSVFSGSFSNTIKVSSEKHKNQLWMAEIPLQFSNRISGKKAGTLWWTIGINNQFRLSLSQNTSKDSTTRALSSDSRTLTSAAKFYQPQFRAGLMYDHLSKLHWQLQPLFQYSMTGVYTKDIADNTVMANLQLQYRMFLQGKKESKKVKK